MSKIASKIRRALPVAILCAAVAGYAQAADEVVVKTVSGKFEDVRDSVASAIEGKGLVVNFVAHVGEMLERTGKDIGAKKQIYAKADVFEFCSAKYSRQMMESDPSLIAYCPYTVAVYALPDQPGKVHLAYRKLPKGAAFAPVEALIKEIVADAAR
jgi:uncharacterized protein (DUF302 family)